MFRIVPNFSTIMAIKNLCKTLPFVQLSADASLKCLRQAQILTGEIFNIFRRLIRLRRIVFLELEQNLAFFKGLYKQAS